MRKANRRRRAQRKSSQIRHRCTTKTHQALKRVYRQATSKQIRKQITLQQCNRRVTFRICLPMPTATSYKKILALENDGLSSTLPTLLCCSSSLQGRRSKPLLSTNVRMTSFTRCQPLPVQFQPRMSPVAD